jgi:hypothetical protein
LRNRIARSSRLLSSNSRSCEKLLTVSQNDHLGSKTAAEDGSPHCTPRPSRLAELSSVAASGSFSARPRRPFTSILQLYFHRL